ncbi:hypothetical protein H8356DRAFT_1315378 [Neocallimastix lanati (nom. inval.)]|nr:hypothetical protein H8356DRAFT_1315378 [Neocallimastix sp. JGI-2020a]
MVYIEFEIIFISTSKDIANSLKDLNEVEETLNRIQAHKGVQGIVIVNHEGSVVKSTLDNIQTQQYSTLITQLTEKAQNVVRDIDPEDNLTFLRLRSKKHEIMVADTKGYKLIVIQNPHEHEY